MKTQLTSEYREPAGLGRAFKNACLEFRQNIPAQIQEAKAVLLTGSRDRLGGQEQVLRLALNEAEALVWQTRYPHLVFPMLAVEKVWAVAVWSRRQQVVRRTAPLLEAAV